MKNSSSISFNVCSKMGESRKPFHQFLRYDIIGIRYEIRSFDSLFVLIMFLSIVY